MFKKKIDMQKNKTLEFTVDVQNEFLYTQIKRVEILTIRIVGIRISALLLQCWDFSQ